MATFLPDDKQDLVDQLNVLNKTDIPVDGIAVTAVGDSQKLDGVGNYTGTATVNKPKRSFATLFPFGAVVKKETGNEDVTGRAALALLNEQFHLTIAESYFTEESLNAAYQLGTQNSISAQIALEPTEDNPYWKDTLFISMYRSTLGALEASSASVSSSIYVDLGSARKAFNLNRTGVYKLPLPTTSSSVPDRYEWCQLLEITPSVVGGQIDWSNYLTMEPLTPTFPVMEMDTTYYFLLWTFNRKDWYVKQITASERYNDVAQLIGKWVITASPVNFVGYGHARFLTRNTGTFTDPETDHYVLNESGVLVNNRHFIAATRQEAQPDGDATTEGQSLLILGAGIFSHTTDDTKLKAHYLTLAESSFDAYINAFYAGLEPPDTPARWIANWIVNGKQPVLAHYPLAKDDYPTHGGFHDTAVTFINGIGKITHGAPTFGEYMDLVVKVYEGKLGWQNLNADVFKTNEDGTIDWSTKGTVFPIEKVALRTKRYVSAGGDDLEACTDDEVGTIVLKDKSVNGSYLVAWAPRVPVEYGGYLIKTNECQHNRPIQVPVTRDYMGNASDAEQWFCEAAYTLYRLTQQERYQKAYKASLFTIEEYTRIDANDKFFRQVKGTDRYDTDGIAYTYTYPSKAPFTITRDTDGWIVIQASSAQIYLEQQAIPFRVNRDSILRVTCGGKDTAGVAIPVEISLSLSLDKTEANAKTYKLVLPSSVEPKGWDFKIGSLIPADAVDEASTPTGDAVTGSVLISADKVGWKDDVAITTEFSEAVEDSWDGLFLKAQLTAAGGQFEFNPTAKQIVRQVSYFASIDYNVRVEDANGWRWWYMLPATTARNTLTLSANGWTLSGYQPGHANTDPKPSAPVWGDGSTEILFLPDDSDIAEGMFKLYAINNPPSTYTTDDGYTMLFTLKATFEAEGTLRVGDCTIVNQRLDPLPYTPGIIPFSNNYIPNAPTFDSWRGQPYPGYQHPWVFLDMDVPAERRDLMIQNVVNFWYDSQQWYYQKFGVLGPGASAYVWDRWDAPSGSKVNDFTMYHFGDQTAWSGYQPRAFFSAVRLYAGLLDHGLAVPEKLTTYISHWIDFLFTYQQENAYQSPTDFPMDKPPTFIPNDFTGHMAGLWLAGASLAMLYGHPNDKGYSVAVNAYNEIVENYINHYTVDDVMNGGWSPAPDSANLGRDGMYFGFWSGEILRGLGYYIALLRDIKPTI